MSDPTASRTPTSSPPSPGGDAFFVDAGGPVEPLIEKADELRPQRHPRAAHPPPPRPRRRARRAARALARRRGPRPPRRARAVAGTTGDLEPGRGARDRRPDRQGAAHARPHRRDALAARRRHRRLHRRHAVQGLGRRRARARLDTTYDDLKPSIMDVLLALPPETTIQPGPHRPDDGRRRAASPTRSSASGAARTPRATSSARRWDKPATLVLLGRRLRRRPQGVGPLAATGATTSSAARRSR